MANMTPNEIFQFPEKQNHLYYFFPLYGITDDACFPDLSPMSQEQPRREAESHSDEMANFLRLPMNNWTNVDCTEWVASVCSRHNIDQNTNSFWTLENCTGQQLLTLSHSDVCQFVGTRYGNTFYEELQRMKNREGTRWSMSGGGGGGDIGDGGGSGDGGGRGDGGGSGDGGGTSQWEFSLPPWMPEDPTWTKTLEGDDFPELTINFDTINIDAGGRYGEAVGGCEQGESSSYRPQPPTLYTEGVLTSYESQPTTSYGEDVLPLYGTQPTTGYEKGDSIHGMEAAGGLTEAAGGNEDLVMWDWAIKPITTEPRGRERGPKVWEFLVRLLENPSSNPSLVMWEEESEGTFRLINHDLITRIWGRRSGNLNLSYTNFARSLRHHYKSGNLVSVRERQLVYGLGNNALRYLNDLRSGRTSR